MHGVADVPQVGAGAVALLAVYGLCTYSCRSDEVLQALRQQQKGNDGLQMRPAGTSAAPSTMQNVTPEVDSQLPPARAVLGVGVGVAKP